MNVEKLEILIPKIMEVDTNADAIRSIKEYIEDPQSIFSFFELIDKHINDNVGQISAILITRCLKQHYESLNPQIQDQIKKKMIFLIFSVNNNLIERNLLSTLINYIKGDLKTFLILLPLFDSCFEKKEYYAPLFLLSHSASFFCEDSPFFIENKDKFFNYILTALQSKDRNVISESIRFYFKLKQKKLSVKNEQHLDIIFQIVLSDLSDSGIWYTIKNALSKNLLPKEKVEELCNCIGEMDIMKNPLLLSFLINSFEFLNNSQIYGILCIFCHCYITQFLDENFLDFELINELKKSLKKHPINNIYEMLNDNLNGQNILKYSIIIKICPKEFLSDVDSFILNVKSAIDKNDHILNMIVCNVLYTFQETFHSYDFLAIEFLPLILKFFKCIENLENVISLIKLFCDCINVTIPGLLKNFYLLNEYFHGIDYSDYISILIKIVKIDNSMNLIQMKSIINDFPNKFYFDIINENEDISEKLFSPEKIKQFPIEEMKVIIEYNNLLVFIKKFGLRFKEQLQPIIQDIYQNSHECYNLETLCVFANRTNDTQFARKLWEKCLNIIEERKAELGNALCSICYIIKLMDKKELKKLLFIIYLFVIKNSAKEIVVKTIHPLRKLLRYSSDEDKEFYLNKCMIIFEKITKGLDIFSCGNYFDIMNEIGLFVSDLVIYQSSYIEQISDFIIKVIKSFQNLPFVELYIGACCNLFIHKTISQKVKNEIIDLIPQIIDFVKYQPLKQKTALLIISMAQYDDETFQCVTKYVAVLQNWYLDEKKLQYVHKDMLSTFALAFLTFFAKGMKIELTLLDEAISEFPPADIKITSLMIKKFIDVFKSNKFELTYIQNAALALSNIFLLSDEQLEKRNISVELMNEAKELFICFSKSSPEIMKAVNEKYKDSF